MENIFNQENEFKEIKIDYIKSFLDNYMKNSGMYQKINQIIGDNINPEDEDNIIRRIKDKGILNELLEGFKNYEIKDTTTLQNCLMMKIVSGSNFIDYQKDEGYFIFDILFLGQRFETKPFPISSNFSINESFILHFNPLKLDIKLDMDNLKRLSCPIHIVMLSIDGNHRKIVASKSLEWRWTLTYGSWKIVTELYSPEVMNKLNVGSIEVHLSLLPFIDKSKLLQERLIDEHLNSEKKYEIESKIFIVIKALRII